MAKLKFTPSFLLELTNEEFHGVTRDIFKVFKGKEIEDSHLLTILNNAENLMPELINAVKSSRFHENTAVIHELADERRELLKSLNKSIEADVIAETDEQRAAARILLLWIRKEKKNFRSTKVSFQSAMIQRLQEESVLNDKISTALEELSLKARFDKIVKLSDLVDQKLLERTEEVNENSIRTLPIKMEVYEATSLLLTTTAGLANMKNSDSSSFYYTIGKSLQSTLTAANAALSYRKTVNAKKKDGVVDDDIELDDIEAPKNETTSEDKTTSEKPTDNQQEADPKNSNPSSDTGNEEPQD